MDRVVVMLLLFIICTSLDTSQMEQFLYGFSYPLLGVLIFLACFYLFALIKSAIETFRMRGKNYNVYRTTNFNGDEELHFVEKKGDDKQ